MAPYLGMLFEQALGLHGENGDSTYQSRYGVTDGWHEPHEFGYFWSRWFPFGDTHKVSPNALKKSKFSALRKEVAALESVYQRPMYFKNSIVVF